jgi:hypothetical protein
MEDEMGRACSTHGDEEECIHGFARKSRREETIKQAWT